MMRKILLHIQQFANRKLKKEKRGVALITAIAAMTLMTYLAVEVMYDTQVEYIVHSQNLNRLKAYYAARSGLEISLLRIKIYQSIMNKLGKNSDPTNGMIDQIWKFPLVWPLPIPEGLNAVDSDVIKNKVKESQLDSSFFTDIQDEGGRIDINDLNSPSKVLREVVKTQILNIFKNKIEADENFAKEYSSFKFDELVNNITDWMTDKNSSLNGGDKKAAYKEDGNEDFPPNRGFRTLQELRMVAGMTDDLFETLAPHITIYGLKGINPNTAKKDVLKAIDPGITDEIYTAIQKRIESPTEGGPFKSDKDFWAFLQNEGAKLSVKPEDVPIVTTGLFSFRIKSIGEYAGVKKEIEVVVLDIDKAATRLGKMVKEENDKQNPQNKPPSTAPATPPATDNQASSPGSAQTSEALSKGAPRIVYWTEK
jgi:general secretion pathway protein K